MQRWFLFYGCELQWPCESQTPCKGVAVLQAKLCNCDIVDTKREHTAALLMLTAVHLQSRSLIDVQTIKGRKVSIPHAHFNLRSSTPALCVNWRNGNAAFSTRARCKGLILASSRRQLQSRRPRALNITTSEMSTDTSTTQERKISFKNSSGDLLSGILVDVGSSEAAVLCHGYADTKNGFHLPALAQALATRGCSTIRY